MDLDLAKSRASYYASSRLTKMYCSKPNIMLMKQETAIQVPSVTIGIDGVEDTDQTQCSDVGLLCETAEYICCHNGLDGKDE
ncbi:unnamed protein product [Macrosiphum euphorbiae]|uniref:Uncharacterized protein n=1 Tax=Macrosiphum euphorbiae TaxID=13131 RepID=A0AAV0XA70_9HEMI|nr:unnamed protein product [Macrosiphum euphorbiae]